MKRFKIDLSDYSVTIQVNKRNEETKKIELVTEKVPYPIKKNISDWLTVEGIFKGGMECCKAFDLSKQIENAGDEITLDETELKLITTAMDALIAQKPDPTRGVQSLGGRIHETCIRRVFQAEEVK